MKQIKYLCVAFMLSLFACTHNEIVEQHIKPIAYPTDSILLEVHNLTLLEGTSIKIDVVYNTTNNVAWESSNEDIAIVSDGGIVKALKTGVVYIIARCYEYDGATDTVSLEVTSFSGKEYVPTPLLDWGASRSDVINYVKMSQPKDWQNLETEIVSNTSNSETRYSLLAGSEDAMLLAIRQSIWGNPDTIIEILKEEYTFISQEEIEYQTELYFYDYSTETTIYCSYWDLEGAIKLGHKIKKDVFTITYSAPVYEILKGELYQEETICDKMQIAKGSLVIELTDGEIFHIVQSIGKNEMPFIFRNSQFNEGDRVMAIGALYKNTDGCENIYNTIYLLGLIRE